MINLTATTYGAETLAICSRRKKIYTGDNRDDNTGMVGCHSRRTEYITMVDYRWNRSASKKFRNVTCS